MIRKSRHTILLTILALLCFNTSSLAQYSSEDEKKDAANEMFANENYVGAIKLFSQLLSTYPKDPSYNYKYGACVLYGSRDKDKALKYLEFAVTKSNVDPIAYYFLAKAYHHNYQFAAAVVNYNKYKGKTTTKEHQKYKIGREIKMCQNGERLLNSITDIGVLSKKEIKATDFFRSYKLNGIGGKIIVKPDDFKTKLDKKNNENSVIYLGEKKDMVVFSSYGKGGSTGKDIYRVVKLPGGEWSKPVLLSDEINSEYDEDYPFLHPDGRTLYFSSKGFNSMGGYDIFKSTLDARTGKWSYPENLDFPINTPDDDILYISDIDNRLAYFASSRASKQGELTVYKVTVDAPPVENSIIKGFFLAESNPNMKSATITIKDAEKDKRYGVYKTHNVTGEYLLVFPKNGGKFKILVETVNDAPIHSAIIELPVLDGFRALKQELRLVGEGEDEKLVIKNLFDESDEFDITDPLVVENILKQKAKLDVNITEAELNNTLANSLNNALANQEESEYSDLSDDQIINKTDEIASKINEQAKLSKEQANTSYQIANKKSAEAKGLNNESKSLSDAGDIEGAEAKKMEAAKLINEVVAALAVAKTLDSEAVERESDITAVNKLQESVNTDIDNGKREGAENNLEKLNEIAAATYHNESALETEAELVNKKLAEKEKIYKKTRDNVTELLNREYELSETVNKLEAKKDETKKKSEKADLDARIQALNIDIEDTKFDLTNARIKAKKAENEYDEAKNKVGTTKSVIALIEDGNKSGALVSESSKLQLENDITYFEKEGLVGLYPSDEQSSVASVETYDIEEHKDEYEIIDDSGELIDYNTKRSVELTEADNAENPTERASIIVKINESWIRDIDEEIAIRKNQLKAETNSAKKSDLEDKIASLEVLKAEKQREIDENTEIIAQNTNSTNEITNPVNNNSNSVATNNVSEEVEIMNTDGTIIDYGSKYTNELETFTEEDDFDSYTKKIAIHNNWASATEQEILIKKMELTEANDDEKNTIENEIAVLENNLLEQQEFAALYDMQAESMRTTEPVVEDPIVNETIANQNNENASVGNYEENYTAELEEITGEDSYDSFTEKAAIHKGWSKAIEEDIATKKLTLSEVNESEKNTIENEIAVLENNLAEQQEFVELYELQAESMKTTEPVIDDPIVNNEDPIIEDPVNTENTTINETENTTNNAGDNYEEQYTAELEEFTGEDDFDSYTKKALIHTNWSKEIEGKIATKELELPNANEVDKNAIENEIAILESDYLEQQEFAALYDMQAESMRTTEPVVEDPLVNNEEPTINIEEPEVNTENSVVEEPVVNNEQPETNENIVEDPITNSVDPVVNNELAEENLTVNNLDAPEDDFSNLKYNNNFNYKSTQSKNTLAGVAEMKNEAKELKDEAEVKLNTAAGVSSQEEKDQIITEADELTDQSNRKQEQIAKTYESANRNEYYNNQSVISKLQEGESDPYANKTIMMEMLVEESDNYYEEASERREDAANATNFTVKQVALQDAYELEMKAIEKQKMAINQLSDGDTEELYANANNANERTTNVIDPETNVNTEEPVVEEPLVNAEEPVNNTVQPVATSSEITAEDQEIILNLQPEEIAAIKENEEYQNYAELKKENRRLVKEAEVEYVEAEKIQEDANDQKQLGLSLNAMAAGAATEEDKAKKLAQIEKLNKMIAENEAKSANLKESATNKEAQAKEANDKSNLILINAEENEAKSFTAIEKAETFDTGFMAEAMNKTSEPTVEDPLANNEQPEVNSEEPVVNTEEPTNNTEEPVVEDPIVNNEESETNTENPDTYREEPLVNNDDPVIENTIIEEPITNIEEPVVEQSSANSVPENIDVIPTILNKSIFVINNNQAAYNENKRIPVSPKLPEGLVFKVQIGAFRNPIPQSHFKGFAPIMAEDAGNGITRYTAGLFKTFNMANEAKKSIRSIGYSDAFVVAFLNGKRININQARAMLDENSVDEGDFAINNASSNNNTSSNTNNPNNVNNSTTNNNTSTSPASVDTEEVNDGVSTDVRNIDGVFYSVQVGVYSKQVTAGQLSNVSPLNSERTSGGLIRYTSGVYKTLSEANSAKDRIRGLGISDAFVVAYNGGTKITVAEATNLLGSVGTTNIPNDTPVEDNPVEDVPVEDVPVEDVPVEDVPVEENPTNNVPGYEPKEDLDLEFKVRLGEYEEDVPVEDAGLFLQLTGRGVKNYEKGNKTVYTIGSFPDYESALDLQIEMKEMGIKNPQTIVFRDGVEMSLEDAFELMKDNQ